MIETDQGQSGRCLCGKVSYTLPATVSEVGMCHCATCRRWGGGGAGVSFQSKEPKIKDTESLCWWKSTSWSERGFCQSCGSSMFWRLQRGNDEWIVHAGTIDNPGPLTLSMHIYIDAKPPYYEIEGDTPRLTGKEFTDKVVADMKLGMRLVAKTMMGFQAVGALFRGKKTQGTAGGPKAQCCCGAVKIDFTDNPKKFILCQCSMCRRANSDMGVLWADVDRLQCTDDSHLRQYQSSDAVERGFCDICGSSLTKRTLDGKITSIAVGALENGSGLELEKFSYADSAPDYFTVAGSQPRSSGEQNHAGGTETLKDAGL